MENNNEKKLGKKGLLLIIVAIVICGGLIYGGITFKKTENKILMGTARLAQSEDIKYTAELSTDFQTGVSEFDALISSLKLQVKSYMDIDDGDNKVETAILIDDKKAVDISIANVDEYIYLELPGVTEDFYYYKLDEVSKNTMEDYIEIV